MGPEGETPEGWMFKVALGGTRVYDDPYSLQHTPKQALINGDYVDFIMPPHGVNTYEDRASYSKIVRPHFQLIILTNTLVCQLEY